MNPQLKTLCYLAGSLCGAAGRHILLTVYHWWVKVTTQLLWPSITLGKGVRLGRCRTVVNPRCVKIGDGTRIEDDWVMIDKSDDKVWKRIIIGKNCHLNHDVEIHARERVTIGNNVTIAPRVFIGDCDHVINQDSPYGLSKGYPVTIEDGCWIGVGAVILKGVTIGHHSVVGANAVVTHNVSPYTKVGGIPARPIGFVKPYEKY